ncbi:MAG: class I SAM-dependent methyltransferase [Thaumarchaeota archaeon]|nr:class I SAM-dependent methyltransferase [Nitrososphaerota archaeon]MBI3641322.1 class I SAM-dependent methyltransferase [Nitrososphaerota archaeon]
MTFSKEWDQRYKDNTNMSVWPWSDMVSYVVRYCGPINPKFRILELGCGAGANIPFFTSFDVEYYAIEGSTTMVNKLKDKYPKLKENLRVGDFTHEIPFDVDFDLVVDRSSVTHNTTEGIRQCLKYVHKKLKMEGKYVGIDWFSTLHSEYPKGLESEDLFTRTGYQSGQFAHVGRVHFSDKPHLLDLFKKFDILVLEHKIVKTEIPDEGRNFAYWNFVAKKNKS